MPPLLYSISGRGERHVEAIESDPPFLTLPLDLARKHVSLRKLLSKKCAEETLQANSGWIGNDQPLFEVICPELRSASITKDGALDKLMHDCSRAGENGQLKVPSGPNFAEVRAAIRRHTCTLKKESEKAKVERYGVFQRNLIGAMRVVTQ